ncbi:hypothetical protein GCM10010452_82150 [Crossiella cryophila]
MQAGGGWAAGVAWGEGGYGGGGGDLLAFVDLGDHGLVGGVQAVGVVEGYHASARYGAGEGDCSG